MNSTVAPSALDRVRACVAKRFHLDVAAVTSDTTLFADFSAYDIPEVDLVMTLQKEFGVEITDDEAQSVKTVADTVALIDAKVSDAQPT